MSRANSCRGPWGSHSFLCPLLLHLLSERAKSKTLTSVMLWFVNLCEQRYGVLGIRT